MDGGVLDAGSSFQFNNLQDITNEDDELITMINSNGSDFFTATDGIANLSNQDIADTDSFIKYDDNRLSLSLSSYYNGSSRSLTPSGSSELMDYQITDWQEHLSSLNTSEDEYDAEVLDVCNGLLLDVRSGNSRMRCFSTSSLTGPCYPPDLIMETRDAEDFLNDSFHELEDVQQQIYLEDIHKSLETGGLLSPIDDCMDGASLQKELIDKLTGLSNPPSLAFDNNVGVTEWNVSNSQPVNEEVKMVNATPGSENISIDGMDVSLPAGSIVLAVVNESGSLVPYSVDSHVFNDKAVKLNPEIDYCLSTAIPQNKDARIEPELSSELEGNYVVYSPTDLINHLEVTPNLKGSGNTFISSSKNNLVSVAEAAQVIKKKLTFESNDENSDEIVDVETVTQSTPVLEACDLATLLYEFEATESVNNSIIEANNDVALVKDIDFANVTITSENQDIKIEKQISTDCYSSPDSHSLHPILAKALEKVAECSGNQTSSSITITSTRPTIGGNSSTTTTSISIKVKKVDGKKPVKSLIERKNELMKKKLVAHQRIKDALPLEIIEKIRASGVRKTTKILTESLLPKYLKRKKFQLPKTNPSKRQKKNENKIQEAHNMQCEENLCATSVDSVFQEHDYCLNYNQNPTNIKNEIKPELDSESMRMKIEIKQEPKVYNKIPAYCQPDVFINVKKEIKPETSPRIVDDANSKEDIILVDVLKHGDTGVYENSDSTNVYNRLPDYVTDIVNSPIKIKLEDANLEQNSKEDEQKNPNEVQSSKKPKKKLKLSEYRMRIRSNDNSRCSSPSVSDAKNIKGIKSELSNSRIPDVKPNVIPQSARPTPLGVVAVEFPSAEKDNVYSTSTNYFGVVPADDDCQFLQEKRNITASSQSILHDKQHEDIPKSTKDLIKVKRVSSLKIPNHRAQISIAEADKSLNVAVSNTFNSTDLIMVSKKQRFASGAQNSPKKANVIEIDLEEGELEDNDGEGKIESANKLALLSMLPLSKMPPTSLGHSLLYSRKINNKQAIEELSVQKMQKVPSSSMSNSSITSSSSSLSSHRYNARNRRSDRSVHHSSSRSRSRSHSRKRLYRRSQSPRSSRLSSHRKSLRRWTRSGSRSSHRRSRSYSSSSVRSYSSRSRSRSRSYSSRSRSRSRSKNNRRKTRHSRRYRRSSRSRDRYHSRSHSRSRSRSRCYEDRRHSSREYYDRSDWSYGSSRQPHMYTRHMSKYRSLVDVERDVEERKIIYCGCIEEGTTRAELKRRFEKFGPIVDSNIHFRENGDNYGFVTFLYSESAFQALEHGKEDPLLSKYNLCFGGRRKFCGEKYSDLDAQKDDYDYYNSSATMDYDTLLQTALNRHR